MNENNKYITNAGDVIEMAKDFYPFTDRQSAELAIDRGNKAVIASKMEIPAYASKFLQDMSQWCCGYVVFHHTDVPVDFAFGYDRSGLEFLNVHGGFTYTGLVPFAKDKEKWLQLRQTTIDKYRALSKEYEDTENKIDSDYWNRKSDIHDWSIDEQVRMGYEWIVFGFDTNHHSDELNPLLKDPEYVFKLTVQMEEQLKELASIYDDFKQHTPDIKKMLIQKIREKANIECEFGLGAILKLLAGEEDL